MDAGTALVGLGGAAIGAGAVLGGGYLGARWQARSTLAQWQRDRLLQFAADLLAAGGEIDDISNAIRRDEKPDRPRDLFRHLSHAYECISLLSQELHGPANDYRMAILDFWKAAPRLPFNAEATAEEQAIDAAFAMFVATANALFIEPPATPRAWRRTWIASAGTSSRLSAAVGAWQRRFGRRGLSGPTDSPTSGDEPSKGR